MKKISSLFATILVLAFTNMSHAEEINAARWDSFCKHNQKKCEIAERICEMSEVVSCDEVRLAFILNRRIPALPGEEINAEAAEEDKD